MPWKRFRFKQNKTYIYTDDTGEPIVRAGRISLRYKLKDKRTYSGSPRNLAPLTEGPDAGKVWGDDEAAPLDIPPDTDKEVSREAAKEIESKSPESVEATTSELEVPEPKVRVIGDGQHGTEGPYLNGLEPIVIYTDGACSGNPGPAGAGVVMMCAGRRKELSAFLGQGTNNIAELTAILRGLQWVKSSNRTLLIHTDSSYSIGVLSRWKAKANAELIGQIKREMRRFADLRLIKVAGHAGIPENERCDELARQAVSSRQSTAYEG